MGDHRGHLQAETTARVHPDVTIGAFLDELRVRSDLKSKTLEGYAGALRKIVADVNAVPHGRGGGVAKREAWRLQVNAFRLSELTPAKVEAWKRAYVARAGDAPIRHRAARISANSFLRRAKALFAPDRTKDLAGVQLPNPLPFDGVDFYKRASMKYRSTFDVVAVVEAAVRELAPNKPEQFKIFLLAIMAGLRRRAEPS
ncbi:MAG TPA: hypothetical protein VGD78_15355 [Chthoniobacterales bacterium]